MMMMMMMVMMMMMMMTNAYSQNQININYIVCLFIRRPSAGVIGCSVCWRGWML